MLSAHCASGQQYFVRRKYYRSVRTRCARLAARATEGKVDRRSTGLTHRLRLTNLPWFAVLIPVTYVINLWLETGVSVLAVLRSLLIVAVVALGATTALAAVTRRPPLAGVIVLLAFGLLVSRGIAYAGAIVILAAASLAAFVLWSRIRSAPLSWERAARVLNGFSLLILAVVLAGGITNGSFASIPDDLRQGASGLETPPEARGTATDLPDVYLVLLDGYPRTDWLQRLFGASNQEFLGELRDLGFDVAERSSSNYMFTELTLTSMLNMSAIPDIPGMREIISGEVVDRPRLREALNDNAVFSVFRSHGYRTVSSSPGYEHVSLRRADVYLDGGQLDDFEYHLVRYTVLQWLTNRIAPDFFGDQQRDRIRSAFTHLRDVMADEGPPTFAFIHVPAPHPPIVLTANGGRAAPPPSGDVYQQAVTMADLDADAYAAQLSFLNGEVLEVLNDRRDPPDGRPQPIILVMSDHGAAPRPETFEGDGQPEHYANLFAARVPGVGDLYADDISPVNVFRILFNRLFDTDFAMLPDTVYHWGASLRSDAPAPS
jgi:hypothetical protein